MFVPRLVVLLVFGGIMFVFAKKRLFSKKTFLLYTALLLVLLIVSLVFPFENAFIAFDSPERAFEYAKDGQVSAVVEGNNSSMVVFQAGDRYCTWFTPKAEDGYKLPGFYESKTRQLQMLSGTASLDASVFVTQINGDYYFQTGFIYDDYPVLENMLGRSIPVLEDTIPDTDEVFVFAYDYIPCSLDEYYFLFNGNRVEFQ